MTAAQVRIVRLGLIVALIALWEIYARFISTSSLIAGPSDVALAWWPKVMGEPQVRIAVLITLVELIVAFVMSVVFGLLGRVVATFCPPPRGLTAGVGFVQTVDGPSPFVVWMEDDRG